LKIAIISDAYYPHYSGVTEYAHGLATYLKKFGHSVDIITGSYGECDRIYPAIRIGKVISLPALGSFATLPIGFDVPQKMRTILKSKRYDVIHLNGPFFPNLSFFAMKYANCPVVATFHTASEYNPILLAYLYRLIFGEYYKNLSLKIAVSNHALETYKPFIPGEYTIIPNGVDSERFTPYGEKIEWMQKIPTILFVGRLDKRKGLHRLLNTLPLVVKKKKVLLVVVGKGPLYKDYLNMVKKLHLEQFVKFVGRVSEKDLPKYYRSARVYTSPALGNESFGIVLLEAMASGTPVVASNIKGYNEVIEHEKTGLLVDTSDKIRYSEALVRLLEDDELRKKLIDNALEAINQKYSWACVTKAILAHYNKII